MRNKVKILNIGFNPTNYNELVSYLKNKKNRIGYICFPDLYNIFRANENEKLYNIYEKSSLTMPDGIPSQFLLRRKGYKDAITISGYWLCCRLFKTNLSHYFYGTSPDNIRLMESNIKKEFPNANILGFKSPPFVNEDQINGNVLIKKELEEISNLNPDIIWIGIGSPKQDMLMHFHDLKKEGTVMIGVGAVFDYFAGTAYMGPEWLKKIGLRWLFHLIRDPKRYSKRIFYTFNKLIKLILNGGKIKQKII